MIGQVDRRQSVARRQAVGPIQDGATVAGGGALIVWIASLAGIDMPVEVAGALGGIVATIANFARSWFAKD